MLSGAGCCCHAVSSVPVVVNDPQDASTRVHKFRLDSHWISMRSQTNFDFGDFGGLQARNERLTPRFDGLEVVFVRGQVVRVKVAAPTECHSTEAGHNVRIEVAVISHLDPRSVNLQHLPSDRNHFSVIAQSLRFKPSAVDDCVEGAVQV